MSDTQWKMCPPCASKRPVPRARSGRDDGHTGCESVVPGHPVRPSARQGFHSRNWSQPQCSHIFPSAGYMRPLAPLGVDMCGAPFSLRPDPPQTTGTIG